MVSVAVSVAGRKFTNGYKIRNMVQLLLLIAGSFVVAWVWALMANHWAMRAWRKTAGEHWTQRARALFPARAGAGLQLVLIPTILALAESRFILHVYGWPTAATAATACAGVLLANRRMGQQIYGQARPFSRAPLFAFVRILALSPWILLIAGIFAMPSDLGPDTFLAAAGILLWFLLLTLGSWWQILYWLGLLREADQQLQARINTLAAQMNVRVRRVWIFESWMANGYASPITREVLLTSALCEKLPPTELMAICAHELAHLGESRWVKFRRHTAFLAFFPLVFANPITASFSIGELLAIVWAALALLALVLSQRMARRMEVRADSCAAENAADQATYARALERIYQINLIPAVMSGRRRIHPHLYDRMLAAGVTPDYPRPLPPRRFTAATWIQLALLFLLAMHVHSSITISASSKPQWFTPGGGHQGAKHQQPERQGAKQGPKEFQI